MAGQTFGSYPDGSIVSATLASCPHVGHVDDEVADVPGSMGTANRSSQFLHLYRASTMTANDLVERPGTVAFRPAGARNLLRGRGGHDDDSSAPTRC